MRHACIRLAPHHADTIFVIPMAASGRRGSLGTVAAPALGRLTAPDCSVSAPSRNLAPDGNSPGPRGLFLRTSHAHGTASPSRA